MLELPVKAKKLYKRRCYGLDVVKFSITLFEKGSNITYKKISKIHYQKHKTC